MRQTLNIRVMVGIAFLAVVAAMFPWLRGLHIGLAIALVGAGALLVYLFIRGVR